MRRGLSPRLCHSPACGRWKDAPRFTARWRSGHIEGPGCGQACLERSLQQEKSQECPVTHSPCHEFVLECMWSDVDSVIWGLIVLVHTFAAAHFLLRDFHRRWWQPTGQLPIDCLHRIQEGVLGDAAERTRHTERCTDQSLEAPWLLDRVNSQRATGEITETRITRHCVRGLTKHAD